MPIRAVTFDFWCTLFRNANSEPRQAIRIEAFHAATGVPREDIATALDLVWGEFFRHHIEEQRTLYPEDAVRLTAQHLRVTLAPDVAADLARVFATAILEHSPEPIDGALDAVRAAAARGPVGLISDSGVSPGSSLRALLDRHGFAPYLEAMVFSDEVGVAKPQALMFETAARGLGVDPRDLLHIGDLEPTDIAGARAVGAVSALFVGDNANHLDGTQADHVFRTWPEFIDRLPALCA